MPCARANRPSTAPRAGGRTLHVAADERYRPVSWLELEAGLRVAGGERRTGAAQPRRVNRRSIAASNPACCWPRAAGSPLPGAGRQPAGPARRSVRRARCLCGLCWPVPGGHRATCRRPPRTWRWRGPNWCGSAWRGVGAGGRAPDGPGAGGSPVARHGPPGADPAARGAALPGADRIGRGARALAERRPGRWPGVSCAATTRASTDPYTGRIRPAATVAWDGLSPDIARSGPLPFDRPLSLRGVRPTRPGAPLSGSRLPAAGRPGLPRGQRDAAIGARLVGRRWRGGAAARRSGKPGPDGGRDPAGWTAGVFFSVVAAG